MNPLHVHNDYVIHIEIIQQIFFDSHALKNALKI